MHSRHLLIAAEWTSTGMVADPFCGQWSAEQGNWFSLEKNLNAFIPTPPPPPPIRRTVPFDVTVETWQL